MQDVINQLATLKDKISAVKKIGPLQVGKKVTAAEDAVDCSYQLCLKMVAEMDGMNKRLSAVEGVANGQNS